MNHARMLAAIAVAALLCPRAASAAPISPVLLFEKTVAGNSAYDLGYLTGGQDLDSDGRADLLFGTSEQSNGEARIYSGGRATEIDKLVGRGSYSYLGAFVRFVGDIDGDGVSEILASAPSDKSSYLYSGATRARLLLRAPLPWGGPIAALGDINADGVPDFLIAGYGNQPQHLLAVAYSGKSGTAIYSVVDPVVGTTMLTVAEPVGDLDGDGVTDFILGSPYENNLSGVARVLSGRTGSLIRRYDGSAFGRLGAWVHALGDISGDGIPDYVIDREFFSGANGASIGRGTAFAVGLGQVDGEGGNDIAMFDGEAIVILDFAARQVLGRYPIASTSQNWIKEMQPAGDLDGDGTTDLILAGGTNDPPRQTLRAIRLLRGTLHAASVDFAPRACPNLLAANGGGPIELAILGETNGDIAQIDAGTVRFAGVAPLASSARLKDVGASSGGAEVACACPSGRADGIDDLVLRFDADALRAAVGTLDAGAVVSASFSARSLDGQAWSGSDCITGSARGKNRLANGMTSGGEPRAVQVIGSNVIRAGEEVRLAYAAAADAGACQVAVFDLAGRRVADLADGSSADGVRETRWDGKDARGAQVRRGIYFVQVRQADAASHSVTLIVR